MGETFSQMTGPEVAIRMWAQQDQEARPFLEQVDTYRRQLLLRIFRNLIDDEAKAHLLPPSSLTITNGGHGS